MRKIAIIGAGQFARFLPSAVESSLSEAAGGTFPRLVARQIAAQLSAVALLASARAFVSMSLP
ncbi:hypothetical protein C7Y66_15835 [Chroococcidiopsis sp. CCALA 051]|uniref:hypothetical protein n=1 Tax=Chroococcidiopsis sp. CCALA 051 TaxID=869949 RepID=UPI000D0CD07B|nr:hypothetical protein [Chroococcidiopsis sp. CCALA 051]PSM48206.1 hypothetical protein C7Y66_15835 [Chroococcidiopsis sp. CCALA 051]